MERDAASARHMDSCAQGGDSHGGPGPSQKVNWGDGFDFLKAIR
jgi:hypothetical protein